MHIDASLTVRSPTLTAADLSAVLALEPDDSWEPSDSLARRRSPRMRRGYHGLALRASGTDSRVALASLGTRLGGRTEAVQRLFAGGDAEATVVLFTCGAPTGHPAAEVGEWVHRIAAALGTDLVPSGARAAANSTAHLCTWTSDAGTTARLE